VTRRRVVKFLDPYSKASTSTYRLKMGFWESSWSSYMCEYAEVPLMRCRSRCAKFFTTLRSGTSSSIATLVRERNPRVSVFEGTCPKLLTVTTLLIDRSLGNRGCIAHKILVICTEPQHQAVKEADARATKANKALAEVSQRQSSREEAIVKWIDDILTSIGSKCSLDFVFYCLFPLSTCVFTGCIFMM
jgi:hypothetical protein